MKTSAARSFRRVVLVPVIAVIAVALVGCTGRGGGQLPPSVGFSGAASLGFSFSCEDKGGVNPPTGRLSIQLSYADKGTSLIGAPFGIHGTADVIDPVLESAICIGQNPPPGGNELIFLGRFRSAGATPAGYPRSCPTKETATSPLCRFEVVVRDNDRDLRPSKGDYFQISLSSATAVTSELPVGTVFYTRAGLLSSGNLTVS